MTYGGSRVDGTEAGSLLGRLAGLLGGNRTPPAPEDETDRLQTATCTILLEVARADDEFSDAERGHVVDTLCSRFSLSHSDAHALIETSTQQRKGSYDLWHFTNEINKACTRDEKLHIIEEVWRVIYADGALTKHEDYLVHKLAKLLNLAHPELIDAKLRVLGKER